MLSKLEGLRPPKHPEESRGQNSGELGGTSETSSKCVPLITRLALFSVHVFEGGLNLRFFKISFAWPTLVHLPIGPNADCLWYTLLLDIRKLHLVSWSLFFN